MFLEFFESMIKSKSGFFGMLIIILYLVIILFVPLLPINDPIAIDLRNSLKSPGQDGYIFGTDQMGRDLFSRVLYGARTSIVIGLVVVVFSTFIGAPLGLIGGFYSGLIDDILVQITDVLLSIPKLLLAIVTVAFFSRSIFSLIMVIAIPEIPIFFRIVRSLTLSIKKLEYVLAARALGLSNYRILFRHILPNLIGPLSIQISFSLAYAILILGVLSFLGLGIRPPTPEWGAIMAQGRALIRVAPHIITYPGIALSVFILGCNLLGDALRQTYDPRFYIK